MSVLRYRPHLTHIVQALPGGGCIANGPIAAMEWADDGEWVHRDDVLAAIQTVIDQCGDRYHEWRNGAVLVYNKISESQNAEKL